MSSSVCTCSLFVNVSAYTYTYAYINWDRCLFLSTVHLCCWFGVLIKLSVILEMVCMLACIRHLQFYLVHSSWKEVSWEILYFNWCRENWSLQFNWFPKYNHSKCLVAVSLYVIHKHCFRFIPRTYNTRSRVWKSLLFNIPSPLIFNLE